MMKYSIKKTIHVMGNRTVHKDCPVEGCQGGLFAVPHKDCSGRGCNGCSTDPKSKFFGKVRCRYCEGAGCEACEGTGIFRMTCRFCMGAGRVIVRYQAKRVSVVATPNLKAVAEEADPNAHSAFEAALAKAAKKGEKVVVS